MGGFGANCGSRLATAVERRVCGSAVPPRESETHVIVHSPHLLLPVQWCRRQGVGMPTYADRIPPLVLSRDEPLLHSRHHSDPALTRVRRGVYADAAAWRA